MTGTWVDFKAVKSGASMLAVLQRYGVRLKASGKNELRGPCPIHGGKESDSFHANTEKNNFNCFAPPCGAHGNVIDFVAAMEKCSGRDAALKLQDWFAIAGNSSSEGRQHGTSTATVQLVLNWRKEAGGECLPRRKTCRTKPWASR